MALPKYIKKIKSAIDHEFKRNLYKNLVFKGGGVRGIAYMGALEVLDEYRIVENIQRVAETSAGAIAATLVSFRLSIPETTELFNSLDFSKIPQSETKERRWKFLRFKEEENYRRFFNKYGWYSSEYFYHWLEDIIADQCMGKGDQLSRIFMIAVLGSCISWLQMCPGSELRYFPLLKPRMLL